MERATIPINGSVGKTVVSKEVGKEEEEEEEEDLKNAESERQRREKPTTREERFRR
jgi:hypothetical protein